MPGWLLVVLLFGGFIVMGAAWDALARRSKAAAAVGRAAGTTVYGIRWLFMKVCGVGLIAVGALAVYLMGTNFEATDLWGLAAGAYGVYLILPGGKWWFF